MEVNNNYVGISNLAAPAVKEKNTTSSQNATSSQNTTNDENVGASNQQAGSMNEPVDVYESTVSNQDKKNYKPDLDKVDEMIKESEKQMESFRKMLEKLFQKQGLTFEDALGKLRNGEFEVDEETRAAAQEAIGEDGYYGVAKTSERILDFAKAISGGDPSKVETIRDAVKAGFAEAERMWGGKMPEITQQTYDAVMKGLDEWANPSLES